MSFVAAERPVMSVNTLPESDGAVEAPGRPWWFDAVIYQIYPRSFADGNGDGMGDLSGAATKLEYLSRLGVDAVWLSPFYPSPQADAGYDVSDYRGVDGTLGTLSDFDALLASAHAQGLRIIIDLVPNHTSSAHPWFVAALTEGINGAARDRYIFSNGLGTAGDLPPNDWQSLFGGPAWTRVDDGAWYLHLFDKGQPDLNWHNPEVRQEFASILRFWLDRGVDGFRVDVAHALIKEEGLPAWSVNAGTLTAGGHHGPMWDQEGVHEIYRQWHTVLEEYGPDKVLVAEAWVSPADRLSRYVRSDEMQQAFNFIFMTAGWHCEAMKKAIVESLAANDAVGATTTWVLSNHDSIRHSSRFGMEDPTMWAKGIGLKDEQPNSSLGLERARAATLLMLALPGSAYLYQGEELGLPEHTTLADDARQDPSFFRTLGEQAGRDGARVPMPWVGDAPGYGFGSGETVWLPQPASYGALAADKQEGQPNSTLELYRLALASRKTFGLGSGQLRWLEGKPTSLHFANGAIEVIANFGSEPLDLPTNIAVLISSNVDAVLDMRLGPNSTAWVQRVSDV